MLRTWDAMCIILHDINVNKRCLQKIESLKEDLIMKKIGSIVVTTLIALAGVIAAFYLVMLVTAW